MTFTAQQTSALLKVARDTIRAALGQKPLAPLPSDDPDLMQPAGCFVSLHHARTHALRGCVGRLDAVDSLLVAVRDTALSVLGDPRFENNPVTPGELSALEIEVSILSPLRPAAHPLDFRPLEDGIYLTLGDRAGCFLPQVARETGWTREQLLDRLCTEKLGFVASAWRHPQAVLQVFTVIVFGPEPFEPIPAANHAGEPSRMNMPSA